jgi:hypothetical protein
MERAIFNDHMEIVEFLLDKYPSYVIKLPQSSYAKIVPLIQKRFVITFRKIENENIVREFLRKKLIYHPASLYMKRLVENFD